MAIVTTGLYEYDPRGINPDNIIPSEIQTINPPDEGDYYFIIPHAAPFHVDGEFELRDHASGTLLVEGVDYMIGHRFLELEKQLGRIVGGSIRIMNHSRTGALRIKYRTVGGVWGFDDQAILEALADKHYNPIIRSWGQISDLPYGVPPLPHDQNVNEIVGTEELLGAISNISLAIEAAGEGTTSAHIADQNNPHGTTKAHVGLSLLMNYAIATTTQAQQGLLDNVYMTSLKVAQAISAQALAPLNTHINSTGNVHGMVAADIDLGNVANLPVANDTEAVNPLLNNRYMTPYTTNLMLASLSDAGRIAALEQLVDDHINSTGNVHAATPADIGTYTSAEIDAMVAQAAGDTATFDGLTPEEWRDSLPSFEQTTDIINKFVTEYGWANSLVNTVVATVEENEANTIETISIGAGRYTAVTSKGLAYDVPESATVFGTGYSQDDSNQVSHTTNASYRITPDGHVEAVGTAAVPIPTTYQVGQPSPSVPPVEVHARNGKLYVLFSDARLELWEAGGSSLVLNNVTGVYTNSSDSYEMTVVTDTSEAMTGLGEANFITNSATAFAGLTEIDQVAVTNNAVFAITVGGDMYAWSVSSPEGAATFSAISLDANMQSNIAEVSGDSDHVVVRREDGTVGFWGSNANGQQNIDPRQGPYTYAAAGGDMTLLVDSAGRLHVIGNFDDNELTPVNIPA